MASAKEYYAKYKDRLAAHYDEKGKLAMDNPEEANKAVQELLMEFVQETKQRIKDKNLQNDRSVMALVNVMNNKWNTVCASFNPPVLRKNTYRNIVYKMLGITPARADIVRRGGPVPGGVMIPDSVIDQIRKKVEIPN